MIAQRGRSTSGRSPLLVLALLCLLGALPRAAALAFNLWPHGDVLLDAAIAESLAWRGALLVPLVDVRYYPIGEFGFGYPPDQHPPLWPLLGAALVPVLGNGYAALKLWSYLCGLAVIPLAYLAFRRALGESGALFVAALVAASFLMIDFSGNGSLWSALAALYLLFACRLAARPLTDRGNAVVLGAIMGAAVLVNYPAVILPVALVLAAALQHGRRLLTASHLASLAVAGLAFLAILTPWLAYNAWLHGNPIWSQPLQRALGGGEKQVEVLIVGGEVVKQNVPDPGGVGATVRRTFSNFYGNVGFLARQMLVLAPVLNGFLLAALVALATLTLRAKGTERERTLGPLAAPLAILVCHGALALLWPTTKFRYLVPLLPFALGLGAWLLWQIRPPATRTLLAGVSFVMLLGLGAWTWLSVPSHTYYYDGGVVNDNFGQQGETIWAEDARRMQRAAAVIRARGPGAVLGDHLFYYLARQPLVINSSGYSPEVLRHLVERYHVRYAWIERKDLGRYQALFPAAPLYEDERFVLLEIG